MASQKRWLSATCAVFALIFWTCSGDGKTGYRVEVAAQGELADLADAALEFTELPRQGDFTIRIGLQSGADCGDCFSIERVEDRGGVLEVTVAGGMPLGIQYGLYHALELIGFRF